MTLGSVTQANAAYATGQTNKKSTTKEASPDELLQRVVTDTVQLSPEAQEYLFNNAGGGSFTATAAQNSEFESRRESHLTGSAPVNAGRERLEEFKQYSKYLQGRNEFNRGLLEQRQTILGELNQKSGGLLSGVSFSTDLNEPIRATSGAIHGQADAIRSFLQDHKSELDRVEQLRNQQYTSYDQWKANRS